MVSPRFCIGDEGRIGEDSPEQLTFRKNYLTNVQEQLAKCREEAANRSRIEKKCGTVGMHHFAVLRSLLRGKALGGAEGLPLLVVPLQGLSGVIGAVDLESPGIPTK